MSKPTPAPQINAIFDKDPDTGPGLELTDQKKLVKDAGEDTVLGITLAGDEVGPGLTGL